MPHLNGVKLRHVTPNSCATEFLFGVVVTLRHFREICVSIFNRNYSRRHLTLYYKIQKFMLKFRGKSWSLFTSRLATSEMKLERRNEFAIKF